MRPCCWSEIFANSIRHSGSVAPEETVAVVAEGGVVRVEVADRAGPGTPELGPAGRDAEGGRGLQLVAARWGWRRRGGRMVTWFELRRHRSATGWDAARHTG